MGRCSYPFGKKQSEEKLVSLKQKLITKYVDSSLMKDRILIWNSLRKNTIQDKILTENLSAYLELSSKADLYFYLEEPHNPGLESLTHTNVREITAFINQLEPWEEIDAYIFDEALDWFIAVTHEDISLICGDMANKIIVPEEI